MSKLLSTQKILNDKTWFQEIAPTSFYQEDDLERSVILNLQNLFPDFIPILFKKKLKNNKADRSNAPDLAMVKNDYKQWFIIEVELSDHNINHVRDQIDTFYNCDYTDEHAEYIYSKNPKDFDLEAIKEMIKQFPPKLMVIANEYNEVMKLAIDKYDCLLCVFQIFLDQHSNPVYRLNGDHPLVFSSFCFCKLEKRVPYAIRILDTDFFDAYSVTPGNEISVSYNGKITKWKREDSGSKRFLICESRNFPLDPSSSRYMLSYNIRTELFTIGKA